LFPISTVLLLPLFSPFFFQYAPPPDIYTLSLHDALPICEHALPDVLTDEQTEGVDEDVAEDRLPADAHRTGVFGRQSGEQLAQAAGLREHDGQHDEEDADRLDEELDEVRQRDRPHAAEQDRKSVV